MRFGWVALLITLLGFGATRAAELPEDSGAAGLVSDVRRAVVAYEQDGWFTDEKALTELAQRLLPSVCRTLPADRSRALAHLRGQLPKDSARVLFGRHKQQLTPEVLAALTAERRFRALARSLRNVEQCPFWVRPRAGYSGRQTVRRKWVWHVEGGGRVDLTRRGRRLYLGAGGSGRLLLGRGVGEHYSLMGGVEAGGGADLRRGAAGELTLNYLFALPLVVRRRQLNWLYDVELAPLAYFEVQDTRVSWGARLGLGAGVAVLRTREFLPWAGFALAAEHYFPGAGRSARQALRGGLRVGIRWLPSSP